MSGWIALEGAGGGAAVLAVLWKAGVSLFKWQKDLTLKTDQQNKLLFGNGTPEWPGLASWQRDTTAAIRRLDAGQLHLIGQIRDEVAPQLKPNGGDSLRDAVDRVASVVTAAERPASDRPQ
ncbi:MAG: hypothetical protein WB777_14310 [Mycobacterium sp.]